MTTNTMSILSEGDYLFIEARDGEDRKGYMKRLLQENVGSNRAVKSEKWNTVGAEIFFDIPEKKGDGSFVVSGKVVDKDNAYWRGAEEFTFSEVYDPNNGDNVVATITQKFYPGHEAFESWTENTPEGQKFIKAIDDKIQKESAERADKITAHIATLDSLDFTNIDSVLDRLYNLDTEGFDIVQNLQVKKKFEEAGFPKGSTNEYSDKDQAGNKIISSIVSEIEHYGVHQIKKYQIEQRKKQYQIDDLKSQL